MGLEVGTLKVTMDEIAADLARDFAGDLEDVRIQEPDTIVARLAREKLKDVARRLKAHEDLAYETLNWIAGVDQRTGIEAGFCRGILRHRPGRSAPRFPKPYNSHETNTGHFRSRAD